MSVFAGKSPIDRPRVHAGRDMQGLPADVRIQQPRGAGWGTGREVLSVRHRLPSAEGTGQKGYGRISLQDGWDKVFWWFLERTEPRYTV